MNYAELANAGVARQPVYEPGKPIESVAREYGLDPGAVVKLASNENPFGPSPRAREAVARMADRLHLYPDGGCRELKAALAERHGVPPEGILVANGSNEVIELLGHAFLRPGVEAVMGDRAFIVYKLVTRLFGATAVEVPMPELVHDLEAMAEAVTERTRLVFVASPNNPTGTANTEAELIRLAERLPEDVICVSTKPTRIIWSRRRTSGRSWRRGVRSSFCGHFPRSTGSAGCGWATPTGIRR